MTIGKAKKESLIQPPHVQVIDDQEALLDLARMSHRSSLNFIKANLAREARICRLKAEMFAARVEDLSKPLCSVCGTSVNVRNYYLNGNCWKCDSCDEWSWHEWQKLEGFLNAT